MRNANYLYSETTNKIIRAFYTVYNTLGYGFLEKVYENAMMQELSMNELDVQQQVPVDVTYKGKKLGVYFADLVVNARVIVELKSVEYLLPAHEAQLVNYLRGSDMEVGLLLNFGPKPEIRRRVLTSNYKIHK